MPARLSLQNWQGFNFQKTDMPLVRLGGILNKRHPTALGYHTNPGFELTYVFSGDVAWKLKKGGMLNLTGGDMALTQPETVHSGEFGVLRPCKLLWLVIDPEVKNACKFTPFTRKELQNCSNLLRANGDRTAPVSQQMQQVFWRICQISNMSTEQSPYIVPALRNLICESLLFFFEALQKPINESQSDHSEIAREYICKNLCENINVADIARYVGLSSGRLHEIFRRDTGQSPADFLSRQRCARARELLENSRKSITEIAYTCGFSTSQYFATVFRKYTGMSPKEYRQSLKDES